MAWPFAKNTNAQVYQTYGQSERASPGSVHVGLDLKVEVGTPVYSPVTGYVAGYFDDGFSPNKKGLAIRTTHNDTYVFVKLLHLDLSSLQFGLGDYVQAGELVGTVHPWPDSDYHSHLHIELGVGALQANATERDNKPGWRFLIPASPFVAKANPLMHLEVEPDTSPPVCRPLSDKGPFLFRQVTGAGNKWAIGSTALDPNNLTGQMDIAFAVADHYTSADSPTLAPHELVLDIRSSGADGEIRLRRSLVFRGPLRTTAGSPESIYLTKNDGKDSSHEKVQDPGAFIYHFMGLNGEGGNTQGPGPWSPDPGDYSITLRARDLASDLRVIAQQEVTVK